MKKYKNLLKLVTLSTLTFAMEREDIPTNENDISSSLDEINKEFKVNVYLHQNNEKDILLPEEKSVSNKLSRFDITQIICMLILTSQRSSEQKIKEDFIDRDIKDKENKVSITMSFQEAFENIKKYSEIFWKRFTVTDFDGVLLKTSIFSFQDLKQLRLHNIGVFNGEMLSFIEMPGLKQIEFSSEKEEKDITNSQKLLRYINKYLTNPDLTIIYKSLSAVANFDDSLLTRTKFKQFDCSLGPKNTIKKHCTELLKVHIDAAKNESSIKYSSTVDGNNDYYNTQEVKKHFDLYKTGYQAYIYHIL